MSEGISILIPTYKRPHNIEQFALSVENTTVVPNSVEILFGIHDDDESSFKKIEDLKDKCKINIRSEIIQHYPDGKIHLSFLWNQLYEKSTYTILGYFGDDVIFQTLEWDEKIRQEFLQDKAILVCCNDVYIQHGAIATLFFTHKAVHEKIGFYLHPNFRRWYMDTYWDKVYRKAGKMHYRNDILTAHMHPDHFPEKIDQVYKNMELFKENDGNLMSSEEIKKQMMEHVEIIKNLK
jgi:hypothetical protein